VNGFSAYATQGPWVAYVRGEAQTAPSISALPLAARQAIQTYADVNQDGPQLPLQPGTPQPSVGRFELLDTYVGLMLSNVEVSFGRQSISWGTGRGGSLDLGDNIQPINMFRINRTTPLKLPSILSWLGPMRTEFFVGQLTGHKFIFSPLGLQGEWGQALSKQPFIHGQHISFKPTRNFEFGFYRTTIFGGEGYPFTLNSFYRSLLSSGNTLAGDPRKPGKRTSAMDFSYRLPHLRNWVSFYGEALTYDQFSPIAYMDRSAWRAGLFFSHLPMLPKLDFRVEGAYTDIPGGRGAIGPGSFYANGTWRSGYTNNGNLIGDWVGRGGQGAQAWTNYWFNARNRLQFNFRHQKVSQQLMPGGGTLTDVGIRGDYWLRPQLSFSISVQYEKWLFPIIQPNASTNVSASVEILFQPQRIFRDRSRSLQAATADGGHP
jgi:Capsule assembly protein Wzi